MKRSSPLGVVLVCAILGAALLAACAERLQPRFPHLTHLTGLRCGQPGAAACLDCTSCHAPAKDETHTMGADASACGTCHRTDLARVTSLSGRPGPARAKIGFDHDRHLGMTEIRGQCVPCHSGVVQQGRPSLPPMSQCFTCHEHQAEWDEGKCEPCHSAQDLARTLPQSFLRHDQGFARHHGQLAMQDQKLCQSCHSQADCNGCHDVTQTLGAERRRPEKVDTTLVHGGGFLVRHALEARSEPTRCVRCHTPQTCDSCHLERGVSGFGVDSRNPHPPGWVGQGSASGSHGREARRDILQCASCHDQGPATNCIRCHKVGAFGGNPHPDGWRSAREPSESMCRYCHG